MGLCLLYEGSENQRKAEACRRFKARATLYDSQTYDQFRTGSLTVLDLHWLL